MFAPIDMPRSSHYGSNYWEVYSPKLRRIVKLYSDLEYEVYILVETDPNVKVFCEQPVRIVYNMNDEIVESIIDLWVKHVDNLEYFIEVKYSTELDPTSKNSKRSIRQTTAQRLWCQENGFHYNIRTEKDTRTNTVFLSNMKIVLSYIRRRLFPVETDICQIKKIIYNNKISISEIQTVLPNMTQERINESICWLYYKGMVSVNFNEMPFSNTTEVWANVK